jgi:hypothetical protein
MYQDGASSLPLQISLYYHGFYSAALAVLSLLLFIYKSALLPYPPTILGAEVAYVFLYGIVEWIRIRQGEEGCGAGRARKERGWRVGLPRRRATDATRCTHTRHTHHTCATPASLQRQQAGEHCHPALLPHPGSASHHLPRLLYLPADVRAQAGRGGAGHCPGLHHSRGHLLSAGPAGLLQGSNSVSCPHSLAAGLGLGRGSCSHAKGGLLNKQVQCNPT